MSSSGGSITSTVGRISAAVIAAAALAAGAFVVPAVTGGGASSCASTLSSGQSVSTALTSVAAGGTVCLGAGTYTYNASVSKTSQTTVRPSAGVATSAVIFSTWQTNTSNRLTFDSITISADADIGTGNPNATGSTNLTLSNSRVIRPGSICFQQSNNNANVLIDGVDFGNTQAQASGDTNGCFGEGRLDLKASCTTCGLIVKNSTFGPNGDGDGIQAHWGIGGGVTIGPGNTFTGIVEGNCSTTHCDSIQLFGANGLTVTGNYFVNDSTVIANFDCAAGEGATNMTITNNVMYQELASDATAVSIAGGTGDVITHNTLGPGTAISIATWNDGCSNTGLTVRNNVFHDGCESNATGSTFSNNLVNAGGACLGTGGISGSPTYTGGTTPSTWAGFQLTSGSLGHLGGSDGLDVGATSFGS